MDYLPLFARMHGVRCLIVGGGEVAARKLKLILRSGAKVTVIAESISESHSHAINSNL